MNTEARASIRLPAFSLLDEPALAFTAGMPEALHRHPLIGLSHFGAFDQASFCRYVRSLRVAYVGPRSGAAQVRDIRESLRGQQGNTDCAFH